jgi:hypothetical protein
MTDPLFAAQQGVATGRLRQEMLFLSWALMEASLLAPLLLAFLPWARFWPAGLFLTWYLLLMLAAFNLTRLFSSLGLPLERQRTLTAAVLGLAILLQFRLLLYESDSLLDLSWLADFFGHAGRLAEPLWIRDMAVFGLVVLAWWRGLSLSGRRVDMGELGLRFRLGAFVVAPVAITLASLQLTEPLAPYVLLFFLAGLSSLVLARMEQLDLDHRGHPGTMRPVTLLTTGLSTVAAVAAIALFTALLSDSPLKEVAGGLDPLWTALLFLLISALSVVSQLSLPLVAVLGGFITWLFRALGQGLSQVLATLDLQEPPADLLAGSEKLLDEPSAGSVLAGQLIGVLSMIAIVLLVALALSQVFAIVRRRAGEERESLAPDLVTPGLNLGSLADRLMAGLPFLRRWRAAASIRRIYRQMEETAAALGHGRLPNETPFEFLATLGQAWPDHPAETEAITAAYSRVRYGELPEDLGELAAVRTAWQTLQDATMAKARRQDLKPVMASRRK